MKTIKQIADELGISKDKVKYRVRKLPPSCITKTDDVTYITDEGIQLLRDLLVGNESGEPTLPGNVPRKYNHALIELLQKELEVKNKQIETQAAQITDLTSALLAAQQTVAAAQALHSGTMKQTLIEEKSEQRDRGFFARIFGKRDRGE